MVVGFILLRQDVWSSIIRLPVLKDWETTHQVVDTPPTNQLSSIGTTAYCGNFGCSFTYTSVQLSSISVEAGNEGSYGRLCESQD